MSTQTRWLDPDQQASWRALVVGTTLLFDRLDEDLRAEFDLALVEYEILVRLSESQGRMRMAVLAASLAHSRSRVTHTVSRMERAGLVARSRSDEDKRGIVCAITDHGVATLEKAAHVHVRGARAYVVDLVGEEDFAALGRAMNAVADALVSERPEMDIR